MGEGQWELPNNRNACHSPEVLQCTHHSETAGKTPGDTGTEPPGEAAPGPRGTWKKP